jgi:hypothetical protein
MISLKKMFAAILGKAQVPAVTERDLALIRDARFPEKKSAGYVIDLGNETFSYPSILNQSGGTFLASGALVGQGINFANQNAMCNLHVCGNAIFASGQARIAVQCSDTDTSGTYTDPTSGMPNFPGAFASGGILWLNSGQVSSGVLNNGASGQGPLTSGFSVCQGFQRPFTFVRAVALSGDFFAGSLTVNFFSQQRSVGSGGGFSTSPQVFPAAGPINV